MDVQQIPTPAVLVDLDVLSANISKMALTATNAGVKLRPHIKTHKTQEITRLQLAAGAAGITCAKVSEAETMVASGVEDVLIAYPTIGDDQLQRAFSLMDYARVILAFDSRYGAECIAQFARAKGRRVEAYMIIDTGGGRDGVSPTEAMDLAMSLEDLNVVQLTGIITHEGHVHRHGPEELEAVVRKAMLDMVDTARSLRAAGFTIREVSVGSTPGCLAGVVVEGITEWRPGTYVFNDVQQNSLVTNVEDCALTVATTVVSHPAEERYIIDAGHKSLTITKHSEFAHGFIAAHPEARIVNLSEEHGIVHYAGHLAYGERLRVIPVHACPVVNLFDWLYVVRGDKVVARWQVAARGCVR